MNYWSEIEKINARIDIEHPSPADLIAIAVASSHRNPVQVGRYGTGACTFEPGPEKVLRHQMGEYGTNRIRKAVIHYTRNYQGRFNTAIGLRKRVLKTGTLTLDQYTTMINHMIAQARKAPTMVTIITATEARETIAAR